MVATTEPAVRWIDAAPSDGARRNRSLVAYDLAASRRSFWVEQRWDDCFDLTVIGGFVNGAG